MKAIWRLYEGEEVNMAVGRSTTLIRASPYLKIGGYMGAICGYMKALWGLYEGR